MVALIRVAGPAVTAADPADPAVERNIPGKPAWDE